MRHRTPLPPADALAALHRRQQEAIAAAASTSPPPRAGAGIVIVAGGALAFTNAWVALANLRRVQRCTLPIQVWHLGPSELSPVMRRLLARFDVELVDALDARSTPPMRRPGPWECKTWALRNCPFRDAILLDADNVPLADPADLLSAPEYRAVGAILWPDNHMHLPDAPVWKLFGVPYREELEVESGQVVVDTERCWVALNLAAHYNAWSDIYYRYIYGDKETFHFAWRRLDQPFARPEGRPRTVYCHRRTPTGLRRMTAALEQVDFNARTIFHHRTGAKWMLDGENPTTGRPNLDAFCAEALAELRADWDGRLRADPPASCDGPPAIAARTWRLRRIGVDEHDVTLRPGGAIENGHPIAVDWWREGTRLVLGDGQGPVCRLSWRRGAWRGRMLWFERARVELVPLA